MSYAVTVVFIPRPEKRDDFRKAMLENAEASRTTEPGCRQFDVCEKSDGSEIFLYEIYDDEAAFKAHLATAHYLRFNAAVTPWVVLKRVTVFNRIAPSSDSRASSPAPRT